MTSTDYQQHLGYYLARYAFDFSFFLIIIVIFIAIISGIDICRECIDYRYYHRCIRSYQRSTHVDRR